MSMFYKATHNFCVVNVMLFSWATWTQTTISGNNQSRSEQLKAPEGNVVFSYSISPGKSAQSAPARNCPELTGWARWAGADLGWRGTGVCADWGWMEKCKKAGGQEGQTFAQSPDRLRCNKSLLPCGSVHRFGCEKKNEQWSTPFRLYQNATFIRNLIFTQGESSGCDVWCPPPWSEPFHNSATSSDTLLSQSSKMLKTKQKEWF